MEVNMTSDYALNLQNLHVQAQDRSHVIQAANIPLYLTENIRYPHPGYHDQPITVIPFEVLYIPSHSVFTCTVWDCCSSQVTG